jgi:hypothetical protein
MGELGRPIATDWPGRFKQPMSPPTRYTNQTSRATRHAARSPPNLLAAGGRHALPRTHAGLSSSSAIKAFDPSGKTPPSFLHFLLGWRSPATATHRQLAKVLVTRSSIPSAQRFAKGSQCFCPWFHSSSSTPPSPTQHLANDPRSMLVSSLLRGSHRWQGVAWRPACSRVAPRTIQGAFHWSFASFPHRRRLPPPCPPPLRWALPSQPPLLGFRVAARRFKPKDHFTSLCSGFPSSMSRWRRHHRAHYGHGRNGWPSAVRALATTGWDGLAKRP